MAPTEPSGTTISGRPARRRIGRRHGAPTRIIDFVNRFLGAQFVSRLSRRRVNVCRRARPAAPKNGSNLTSR
jgi:hypothetical protein